MDDCIIISPDMKVIDRFIKSMQDSKENFILMDEGDLARFLGVEIEYKEDGSIEMTQLHLIQRILDLCGIENGKVNGQDTPVGKPLLHKDLKGLPRKYKMELSQCSRHVGLSHRSFKNRTSHGSTSMCTIQ